MAFLRRFSVLSDVSRDPSDNVETLRGVIAEALMLCMVEYFQLVTLRLADAKYCRDYLDACLNDAAELNDFGQQLDSVGFRRKQIWRAWQYIRELVVKYLPADDPTITNLDKGAKDSLALRFTKFVKGGLRKVQCQRKRPGRKLTKDEWNSIPQNSLNAVLDAAAEMCGSEDLEKRDWMYDDLFSDLSERLMEILA